MKKAIYPGSFDPLTFGHVDIIKKASIMFDYVVVGVFVNSQKQTVFTKEERIFMLNKVFESLKIKNLEVVSFDGLLVDYAKKNNITVIVKGIRSVLDLEYELQMAWTNKKLNPNLETVFLTASEKNTYLSSSLVKEVAKYGGNISSFVPKCILCDIKKMYDQKETNK